MPNVLTKRAAGVALIHYRRISSIVIQVHILTLLECMGAGSRKRVYGLVMGFSKTRVVINLVYHLAER